jgi:hypothetical protein
VFGVPVAIPVVELIATPGNGAPPPNTVKVTVSFCRSFTLSCRFSAWPMVKVRC